MQHGHADSALIIFLRLPVSGKVKTRIAATEGDDHALAIYLQLMDITLELAANAEKPVYLFFEGGLPSYQPDSLHTLICHNHRETSERKWQMPFLWC
ncbi:MAG: hypothetical protein IPL92_17740 [Saprospiraceae bacterium]|nr:hypothetical protein [Candidatus Opimibacter iunctus]